MRSWQNWIAIAVVGLSSSAVAEQRVLMSEFKLVDKKSGATYGPFPATNGACVRIAGRDLNFQIEKGRANFVAAKLGNFRLPSVELHRVDRAHEPLGVLCRGGLFTSVAGNHVRTPEIECR